MQAQKKRLEDVGFYYAANALGRFFGTLLSGLLYQWGGLLWALIGSALMLVVCWLITLALPVVKPLQPRVADDPSRGVARVNGASASLALADFSPAGGDGATGHDPRAAGRHPIVAHRAVISPQCAKPGRA